MQLACPLRGFFLVIIIFLHDHCRWINFLKQLITVHSFTVNGIHTRTIGECFFHVFPLHDPVAAFGIICRITGNKILVAAGAMAACFIHAFIVSGSAVVIATSPTPHQVRLKFRAVRERGFGKIRNHKRFSAGCTGNVAVIDKHTPGMEVRLIDDAPVGQAGGRE